MSSLAIGQVLEVTAEKLAFGGSAIARHEGAVLFVPFAAPGDHLRVVVTEADKRFYRATIQQVLQPSPHRREPKCSLFGKCGGCQFQHVTYEEQVRQKAEIVRDAIVRIGGFDWQQPIHVHTGEEWGYRSRTQLKCEPGALGFNRPETKTVIDVPSCPVLAPALNDALPQVRAAIATLAASRRTSHSNGPGSVSSKSLRSNTSARSGDPNTPKLSRWASPHSWTSSPLDGSAAQSRAIRPAEPRKNANGDSSMRP